MTPSDTARFWSKVQCNDEANCWLWTAGTFNDGYGSFWCDHGSHRAHRIAWILANGPLFDELDVLHHCDNSLCCNAAHLFTGTKKDNAQDAVSKGRHTYGEKVGTSKLTTTEVKEIREKYATLTHSQRALATEYNVCQGTVWQIVNKQYWKSVQ